MKTLLTFSLVLLIPTLASCDMRSGIAKQEMEKFEAAPTQTIPPSSTGTPINPADIVEVDINLEGDAISIDGHRQNKTTACTKFNRLIVNGDDSVFTIKGVCRRITINGDRNKITTEAAMEFVFNGSENVVKYSRYPNGKQPSVIQNQSGNIIEKISKDAVTTGKPQQRNK